MRPRRHQLGVGLESVHAYTIGDSGFFLGVVALCNSLRLTGNPMPLTLLDLGLTPEQRRLLEPHCEIRVLPRSSYPYLQKAELLEDSSASVVVYVDSDIIVTGSLDDAVRDAASGRVVACTDVVGDRWFAEWADGFALHAPLRREPYVNSGFVAFSPLRLPTLLPRWSELCGGLGRRGLGLDSSGPGDPFWLGDQEALNALLMSEVPVATVLQSSEMAFAFPDRPKTRVLDVGTLRCERRGDPVRFLHSIGHPKPWQARARWDWHPSAYTECLSRTLVGPDLTVRLPEAMVPTWLRAGPVAAAARRVMGGYTRAAAWSRPLRTRIGLSPVRRRDGFTPGRA